MKASITRVGHDAEFMVRDGVEIVPICGRLGGTKKRPVIIRELRGGYQEDNVNAEIGIFPAKSVKDFIIPTYNLVRRVEEVTGLQSIITPSHFFKPEQLLNQQARTAGCSLDYNIYTGRPNQRPELEGSTLRSAGGHIHMEFGDGMSPAWIKPVIKAADILIGSQMVLFDGDTLRRSLYGQAGCYRPKPYGVEYRTPSNMWMGSEELMEWVFGQVKRIPDLIPRLKQFYKSIPEIEVIRCINQSNVSIATHISEVLA